MLEGRQLSDYVQILLFSLLVVVGLPVNISTLVYMIRRYRHAKSFLLMLHIHLNISDILVLGVYVPGLVGWLISQEWEAGDAMCKIMRFTDGFVLSVSSNIMVCIAVYRLFALRRPVWISAAGHNNVPRMLFLAWFFAALAGAPQFYVWNQVSFPDYTQCQSIWVAKMTHPEGNKMSDRDYLWMKIYNSASVVIVFYIPLIILVCCYVLIAKDIYKTLNNEENSSVMYSEISKLSTCGGRIGRKEKQSFVSIRTVRERGQDKFRRAKVRSLRITLLLILTYVITWLPCNLMAWWFALDFDTYREYENEMFPLLFLVVLNSVINPFIYGRCNGLSLLLPCRRNRFCKMVS